MFSGCPSVSACVRAYARPVSTVTPDGLKDFDQILYVNILYHGQAN